MKLALIFLLAFVATSYQQKYQKRMLWIPPAPAAAAPVRAYYPSAPSFNYGNHPFISGRHLQPIVPIEAFQEEEDDDNEDVQQQSELIQPSSVTHHQDDQDDDWQGIHEDVYHQQPFAYQSRQYPRIWHSGKAGHNNKGYLFQQNRANYYPFIHHQQEEEQSYYSPGFYLQQDGDYRQDPQVQSRGRIRPSSANSGGSRPQNRFFGLGNQILLTSANSFRFPFGKTSGVLVTSTLNLTSVVHCVASSEFVSANPTTCRRRKRGTERLLSFDDQMDSISPSNIASIEATAEPYQIYEERNARLNELLASSKDDLIVDPDDDENNRNKRSFLYVSTTTLTTYSFFSTTVTKTVRLLTAGTTSGLTCLPCSFTVC